MIRDDNKAKKAKSVVSKQSKSVSLDKESEASSVDKAPETLLIKKKKAPETKPGLERAPLAKKKVVIRKKVHAGEAKKKIVTTTKASPASSLKANLGAKPAAPRVVRPMANRPARTESYGSKNQHLPDKEKLAQAKLANKTAAKTGTIPEKTSASSPVVPINPSADANKASSNTGKRIYKAKKSKVVSNKKKEELDKVNQFNFDMKEKLRQQSIQVNPVPKEIDIMETITVADLAKKMNLKVSILISKLIKMGVMATINHQIDAETAGILAEEFDCKVNIISLYEEALIVSEDIKDEDIHPRQPVVTVMGHVDHGKTQLLDSIRQADVATKEHGGITQHIGAYVMHSEKGYITFLDTPGHEAFTLMRARGSQLTDLIVLVVAANDGVMPQTKEAINHAKVAKVPVIVAINKIDLADANPERVKQQLSEYDLVPEEWGGTTQFIEVSALHKTGLDDLCDKILLEAELLNLEAGTNSRAEGRIIESRIDQGRGIVSTILVQRGTLHVGDSFVAGVYPGKVRSMYNEFGDKLSEAGPAIPVEIVGFSGIPDSGDPFQVTENEKQAKSFGQKRQELKKHENSKSSAKLTLDNLYDQIQDGEVQELRVIIKGDVHGSVEALQQSLEKLSTEEVRLVCIHSAAGAIIDSDVNLAAASKAIIIGFNVRPTPKAQTLADIEQVDIRKYNIIYDVVDNIKLAMEGLLQPNFTEEVTGTVEIREVYKISKIGMIAGCMVSKGFISRKSKVNILRDNIVIHTGELSSLKRFKDDAKEVREGFECGLSIKDYNDIKVGDTLEVFQMKEVAKKL